MRKCALFFDAPDGGVAEHVLQLALGMRDRGWDPWLVGPETASIYQALDSTDTPTIKLPFRPGYSHLLYDSRVLHGVIALMRRTRFELVSTHSPKAGAIGRLVAHAMGVPAVFSAHGFAFDPRIRHWPGRAFSLAVERLLARRTGAIICVSEDVRRLALEYHLAPPGALHTVYNAAPACDATLEPDAELERFSQEGPLAGCISVLRPGKGVELFLESARHVLHSLPEARLAVIGNGELRQELERYSRTLGLDQRLRFFDFRRPSARQLRSLDVLVLPSPWEAFGRVLAEAMACGVPQVATAVAAVPEVVRDGETGLLCPPAAPIELAEQMVRLLSDPDLRSRMSEASRERHRRLFTLERMFDETAAVWDRVVQEAAEAGR